MIRDSTANTLRERLVEYVLRKPNFFKPDGSYESRKEDLCIASLWNPNYRLGPRAKPRREYHETPSLRSPIIVDAPGSVVRGTALACDALQSQHYKKVFWLELCDYADTDAVIRDLLRNLANRLGKFQSEHIRIHPLESSIAAELERRIDEGIQTVFQETEHDQEMTLETRFSKVCKLFDTEWKAIATALAESIKQDLKNYRIDSTQLVVFFYGRDSTGNSSGILPEDWKKWSKFRQDEFELKCRKVTEEKMIHGPLDEYSDILLKSVLAPGEFGAFHCFIEALALAGVPTVYFPLSKDRAEYKKKFMQRIGYNPSKDQKELKKPEDPTDRLRQDYRGPVKVVAEEEWQILMSDSSKEVHANLVDFLDNNEGEASSDRGSIFLVGEAEQNRVKASDNIAFEQLRKGNDRILDDPEEWTFDPILDPIKQPNHSSKRFFKKAEFEDFSVFRRIYRWVTNDFQILEPERFKESFLPADADASKRLMGKLQFIYALTLFRQSRHGNALCTEAAYPCPFRFNTNGIDNDFVRGEVIATWVEELRRNRIFFDKPGGSVWIHRDIRVVMQRVIGMFDLHRQRSIEIDLTGVKEDVLIPLLKVELKIDTNQNERSKVEALSSQIRAEYTDRFSRLPESQRSDLTKILEERMDKSRRLLQIISCFKNLQLELAGTGERNRFLFEMRARMHAWIAQWYQQGYYSSGHIDPIIESLHHRFASAFHAPLAKPKSCSLKTFFKADDVGQKKAIDYALDLCQHRFDLIQRSLSEATKLILLSSNDIRMWEANSFRPRWLSTESIAEVVANYEIAWKNSKENAITETRSLLLKPEIAEGVAGNDFADELRETVEQQMRSLDTTEFRHAIDKLGRSVVFDGGGETAPFEGGRSL